MKTIATLIFILFIGMSTQAQDTPAVSKVVTIEMGIVPATPSFKIVKDDQNSVARLYRFKNSAIKKALSFTTKRNSSKLA